jgi:hypothetical protein
MTNSSGYCLDSSHKATSSLPCSDLLSQDECSLWLDSAVVRQSSTSIPSSGYWLESSHQATQVLPSLDLLSQDKCSLCLDSAVARQSSRNIPSFGYCLETSHQATSSLPFSQPSRFLSTLSSTSAHPSGTPSSKLISSAVPSANQPSGIPSSSPLCPFRVSTHSTRGRCPRGRILLQKREPSRERPYVHPSDDVIPFPRR